MWKKAAAAGICLAALAAVLFFTRTKPEPPVETTAAETVIAIETETEPETEAEPEPEDPYLTCPEDLEALKARNSDFIGWLYIPDTTVSYPVLWKENDNDFYLHHDIDRKDSYYGIFLDGQDLPDFSKRHNIIYGHHMKNGTMFTPICDFKDESFFRDHRSVYIYTPERTIVLRTIACFYTQDISYERRRSDFESTEDFRKYIETMTAGCSFRELPEEVPARLFSFVTCSYEGPNTRTILYCVEDPGESRGGASSREAEEGKGKQ